MDKETQNSLLDKVVSAVVAGIILAAVTAAVTYLVVGKESDLRQITDAGDALDQKSAQLESEERMFKVLETGWFAPTRMNYQKKKAILDQFMSFANLATMSESAIADGLSWCRESLIELNAERGAIASFPTKGDLVKAYQKATIEFYDGQISAVSRIESVLTNRKSLTSASYDIFLDGITTDGLKVVTASSAIQNLSREILLENARDLKKVNESKVVVSGIAHTATLKIYASVFTLAGFGYALVFLIFKRAKQRA